MDLEFEDLEPEEILKEIERLSLVQSVLNCEGQKLLKEEYPDFVEKHALQQFDRLKRPHLKKISATEIKVYAALQGISVRKATVIIRQFNRYIAAMRVHLEPVEAVEWLISSETSLN